MPEEAEELRLAQQHSSSHTLQTVMRLQKYQYPRLLVLLPDFPAPPSPSGPAGMVRALGRLKESHESPSLDAGRVHCLCEFQWRDLEGRVVPMWHPIVGNAGKELKEPASSLPKLGPVLKATTTLLQAFGRGLRESEIPFANQGGIADLFAGSLAKVQSLLEGTAEAFEGREGGEGGGGVGGEEESRADCVAGMLQHTRPKPFEGEELLAAEGLFGTPAAGHLEEAGLWQHVVEFDGPLGNAGDVLWLCREHIELAELSVLHPEEELRGRIAALCEKAWAEEGDSNGRLSCILIYYFTLLFCLFLFNHYYSFFIHYFIFIFI
jgi:hypothetical protein